MLVTVGVTVCTTHQVWSLLVLSPLSSSSHGIFHQNCKILETSSLQDMENYFTEKIYIFLSLDLTKHSIPNYDISNSVILYYYITVLQY